MASSSLASGFTTGFGSAFLQYLLERFASLGHLAWGEISLIWDVEEQLRKLQRSFFKVQDLVDHVNCNPLRFYGGGSKGRVLWFEDLRKLSYDADAVLDRVSLHLSIHCAQNSVSSNQEQQVRSMILSQIGQLDLPHEIAKMQKELDALAKEMEYLVVIENAKFDSRAMFGNGRSSQLHSNRSSCVMGGTMLGRERERRDIVDFLCKPFQSNISVISIMGMVGVGKTAVASDVFDLSGDFGLRIWVCVSVEFDAIRVTKSMIEYATGCACNLSDLVSLQRMLRDILSGRTFLLVLDDYWSEKCDDWDILSWPFRYGSRGSKVIVTTRIRKVATIVCSSQACELEILSDDDVCWELIKESAYVRPESAQDLESVGREIVQKCTGVPLLATTFGHMLRTKSTEAEWRSVLKNEVWDMSQDNNIFLRSMPSYLYLAPHLQKCFAYCSIFPQNYEFEMEELVLLWIGEGFIQPNGARTLEDLAIDSFNDLCSRFFFQKYTNASGQTRYKMHDLIHGMARLVSRDICFHSKHENSNVYPLFGNSCHLSLLHESTQLLELKASVRNERLRTFLLMRNGDTQLDPNLFSHLKFLKVLGLSRAGLSMLVDSIDKLIYLRYLNLSENPISRLPKSMCKLVALQILKLRSCRLLRVLPEEMSSLMSLQHLDMDKGMFKRMPPQFGKLTTLQHLSVFVVSAKTGCGVAELKSLNGLRGSLCITGLDASNANDAEVAELGSKPFLDKLELEWASGGQNHMEQAQVLANLQPNRNLKELAIQNYCGMTFPAWLGDSSHHFTSIHLQGLEYCVSLPSLGDLPFLTSFAISYMPSLESVDSTFYGTKKFPSLKSFEIRDLSNLREWSGTHVSGNPMPCLDKFTLHDCPLLSSLPQNLQSLLHNSSVNVSGCGSLQP